MSLLEAEAVLADPVDSASRVWGMAPQEIIYGKPGLLAEEEVMWGKPGRGMWGIVVGLDQLREMRRPLGLLVWG